MSRSLALLLFLFLALVSCEPTSSSPSHGRVLVMLKAGKYQEALQYINAGLEKDPKNRELLEDRLVLLLGSDDPAARNSVIETQKTLETIGAGRRILLDQSGNHSVRVRQNVAYTLGRLGGNDTLKTLRSLADDSDSEVRAEAVHALAKVNSPASKYFLLIRLKDGYWKVRAEAAAALGRMGDSSVTAQLFRVADDRDAFAQSEILEAIIALAHPSQTEIYLKELPSDIPARQTAAALALGKIQRLESVPVLLELLKNKKSVERLQIAQCVVSLGPNSVAGILENLLSREADPQVRTALLKYFEARNDAQAKKVLEKYREPEPGGNRTGF